MTELAAARELMERFAARTAVGHHGPRRYLWTDAFAVCNFLGLGRVTGDGRYADVALRLIDDVHHVLGRHRPDDSRHGWISGLSSVEGEAHPTRGGLRIGKPLPERGPGEPFDERREWDRDGQYLHYATKWMHALDQSARALRQPLFNEWARDLVRAAHQAFGYSGPGGRRRMYWKVSIDLSRPLVPSMGQHDPLDALVTCVELEATRAAMGAPGPSLGDLIEDFAVMVEPATLPTADPLGIGGLLVDAHRVAQLRQCGAFTRQAELERALRDAASAGLEVYEANGELRAPAARRLAFRELGLAIGLTALPQVPPRYAALREQIVSFWLRPERRAAPSWIAHEDINDVMLATALQPEGFLTLWPSNWT